MIQAFIEVLTAGLNLWNTKEKQKYIDQVLSLKEMYYAEINKPDSERDDAVISNVVAQLSILGSTFAAAATTPPSNA